MPIMERVYIPGHNHDAQIADVDYRITPTLTRGNYVGLVHGKALKPDGTKKRLTKTCPSPGG